MARSCDDDIHLKVVEEEVGTNQIGAKISLLRSSALLLRRIPLVGSLPPSSPPPFTLICTEGEAILLFLNTRSTCVLFVEIAVAMGTAHHVINTRLSCDCTKSALSDKECANGLKEAISIVSIISLSLPLCRDIQNNLGIRTDVGNLSVVLSHTNSES